MNLYDEKELTNQFLCKSAKFIIYDEKTPQAMSFQQANSIYEVTR